MERCDFCSVCAAIIDKSDNRFNQTEFLDMLFEDFSRDEFFLFDVGLTSRWMRGIKPLSPKIIQYYRTNEKADIFIQNFNRSLMPRISDHHDLTKALRDLVLNDVSISDSGKNELLGNYPCKDKSDAAVFICKVLLFALGRPFVTRDTKIIEKHTSSGALSPIVSERIFDADIPAPCKHFSGREKELK